MKILAYTSPACGHLFPLVPVMTELAGRGHDVAVRTLAAQVPMMRRLGFEAAAIDPRIEALAHDDYKAKAPPAKLKRAMGSAGTFSRRAPLDSADLAAAIEDHRPDALLVDCMTWGANAVAETAGLPWAQWFPYPMPLPSPDAPPFGPGLAPAEGWPGRVRDRVLAGTVGRQLERMVLSWLNPQRTAVGASPFASMHEVFTAPPLVLYMTAEPFEYPRSDWPSNILQVGPCAWEPPAAAPAWLDDIDRPLVLVTTSSEFQEDSRLVSTALEALADEDVFVVATLPSAQLPAVVPANARVETFVPHLPVLARAACAVTHGGAGATQKALANVVPVCVVPFGRDQMEVARRVHVAGAGTRLPLSRLRPDRLRGAVQAATQMTDGAARVAAGFAAAGGAVAAADAFEALAARTIARGRVTR